VYLWGLGINSHYSNERNYLFSVTEKLTLCVQFRLNIVFKRWKNSVMNLKETDIISWPIDTHILRKKNENFCYIIEYTCSINHPHEGHAFCDEQTCAKRSDGVLVQRVCFVLCQRGLQQQRRTIRPLSRVGHNKVLLTTRLSYLRSALY